MQSYTNYQNAALLILRIITAAIFFVAGYYKFPLWSGAPEGMSSSMLLMMKILSIAEPLGAAAILVGFLTRLASWGLLIIMAGAIYVLQIDMGIGFVTPTSAGWNFPLALLAGCLILAAFGAGRWSIDNRTGRK